MYDAYSEAEAIRREIEVLAASPDLDVEALAPQNVATIARLDRRLGRLESFPLGVLRRFDQADRFMSKLVERLGAESNWPLPRPSVATTSIDDYWMDPKYPLIYAPADWRCLLGLPALGHELAHPLWLERAAATSAAFAPVIAAHIDGLGLDPEDDQLLTGAWVATGKWVAEFACDAVATHVLGEAYPWQHLRHLIRSGSRPYEPTFRTPEAAQVHPADLARLKLCVLVLGNLGMPTASLETEIALYLAARGEPVPAAYAQSYPNSILEAIACATVDMLDALGIGRVAAAPAAGVARLFNDAWAEYRRDALAYPVWESAALSQLKAP